jgi:hypothetical protein
MTNSKHALSPLSEPISEVQSVPKWVLQLPYVIKSELEVTIWPWTFQTFRLVLKVSFRPPNGIPLVQSCLEILPVITESYTNVECAEFCGWFHESPSSASIQRKFKTKYHKNSPQRMTILTWYNRFVETSLYESHVGSLFWTCRTISWPPQSPDLTPLGCFVWRYVKDKTFFHLFLQV